jgi:DNA ligase (NAD+)
MVEQLFQLGLVFQAQEKSQALLTGRVFLFTGTLQALSRNEAKQVVKAQGGQVASSLSHRVTDVVVGEKAGSKRKKAEEMGLALLPEEAFLSLIEGASR